MKVTVIPVVIGALGTIQKGLVKGLEDFGKKKTSRDHPDNSNIEIGQNTEKSFGDLRKLTVTQTPVRNHQLLLVWKTLKRVNNYRPLSEIAQSAGAVEYTDCTSAEGYPPTHTHTQWVSWYDTKQSDGEVSVMLGLWGMRSTPSLSWLPGGCTG